MLGAGKIGEALLAGLLRSGWPAERLLATDAPARTRRRSCAARYGIRVVDNATAVAEADVLVVAVKPQDAGALMAELGPPDRRRRPAGRLALRRACPPRSSPSGCPPAPRSSGS